MHPVFIHFRMPWEKPRRDPVEESKWISETYRIRWEAYKTIRVGQVYEVSDPEMYKTVRQRLKKMVLNNEDKLALFQLKRETD